MDDRRQDEGRNDRSGREQRGGRYGEQGRYSDEYDGQEQYGGQGQYGASQRSEGQRGIATQSRQGDVMDRGSGGSGGGQGDMRGYVLPYRYYGPGYRGVGYYAVFYQGSDQGGEQGDPGQGSWDASEQGPAGQGTSRWGQGDQSRQASMGGGRSQGGFAGRGPKGYQRSDERLREEISDRLMADDRIDASDIEVDVQSSEVTLTGTVPDRWMKRQAEDMAEQVMGVREVMNQLRVQRETEGWSSDQGSTGSRGTGSAPTSSAGRQAQQSRQAQQGPKGQSHEDVTGTSQEPAPNGRRRTPASGSR